MNSSKRKSTMMDSFFIKKQKVVTQIASTSDSVELNVNIETKLLQLTNHR